MSKLTDTVARVVDAVLFGPPPPPQGYQPTGDAEPGLPPRGPGASVNLPAPDGRGTDV